MPIEQIMDRRATELIAQRTLFRTRDAEKAQIPKHWLYRLERNGVIRQVQRGLWTDADIYPDRRMIADAKVADAPRCLLSALHLLFRAERPSKIWVALPRGARLPEVKGPVRFVRMSGASYSEGLSEWPTELGKIRYY